MSGPSFSNGLRLAHYWWPVVMGWSIAEVVGRATGSPVSSAGISMLLCGVLAAYSLDRLVDAGPERRPVWLRIVLLVGVLVGAVGGLRLLPALPASKVGMLIVLGAVALAYPLLKRWPWVKAILVPAVWTSTAVVLPTGDGATSIWHSFLAPVAAPLFALLASGCLLCDLKDVDADARAGVRSVPVALGVRAALLVAVVLALVGGSLALAEHRPGLLAAAIGLIALAPFRAVLATDVVGPLVVDMILTLPGVLVAAHLV